MDIIGQVAVQIKADLALFEKGLEKAKREADRFDQSASKSIRATDQVTKEFASTALQAAAAIQTVSNQANQFGTAMKTSGVQTANIAAQLNDIGVTLAGGQSPFMVAIQQGSQLNQVLGSMGARGAIGALGTAFTSLLNPVSLATIAIIGLGGTAVQYFADVLFESEKTEEALANEAKLIQNVANKWGDATPALKAYAEERQRIADQGQLNDVAQTIAKEQYKDTSKNINDLIVDIANFTSTMRDVGASSEFVTPVQEAFKNLQKQIAEGKATTEDAKAVQLALASAFLDTGVPAVGALAGQFLSLATAIGTANDAAVDFMAEALLKDATKNVLPQLGALGPVFSAGGQFVDENGLQNARANETKSQFQIEQEKLARSNKRSGRGSRGSRGLSEAEKQERDYKDLIRDSEQFIKAQQLEANALGMTEEAANRLRYEQDLLNKAVNDNINLTPQQSAELKQLAADMAATEEATKKATETFEFAKDITRGMFDDIRSALDDGKLSWDDLANVAMNALDRITDKLLNDVMDALFQVNGAASGGGGSGGILGSLFGGLLGGGGGSADPWAGLRFAKGGAFSGGNVIPFARGGVVSRPTMFPMANGAGLMGEAGPEGILPLRRNSSGQLGVMASGAGGSNQPVQANFNMNVTVSGTGDKELEERMQKGAQVQMAQALDQFSRNVLPGRVNQIGKDKRAVG